MLKLELGRCCLDCDDIEIEASRVKKIGWKAEYRDYGLEHVAVTLPLQIGCRHRHVCGKYLNEPLRALPVEQLFGAGCGGMGGKG